MIHIKAIAVGIVIVAFIAGAAFILGLYPLVGLTLAGLFCAYMFGRAALLALRVDQ